MPRKKLIILIAIVVIIVFCGVLLNLRTQKSADIESQMNTITNQPEAVPARSGGPVPPIGPDTTEEITRPALGAPSLVPPITPDPIAPPSSVAPLTPPPPLSGVYCTMDAKQCSDGSYVGRSGPNCEFKKCPGE
jgi:hypothetical protein